MNTTATTQDPYRCEGLDMDFLLANAEPAATLAERIRHATVVLLTGEAIDPAALAELAAAAAELADAAASLAAPTDADRTSADRVIALQSIRQHCTKSGWSPIAAVRAALWHLDGNAQDELLIGMVEDKLVDIIPVANLKTLTGRDHATALLLGGQWTHAIQAR